MIYPHYHEGRVWRWLDLGRHFMLWLWVDTPVALYRGWLTAAANFEAQLAVVATARNLTKPLFQDYTREGRFIGFWMRLARIAAGLVVQLVILLFYVGIVVVRLALPFYLIWQIGRNVVGLAT